MSTESMSPVAQSAGDAFFAEVFDPANRTDPYELYAKMRNSAPLLDAGNHMWFTFNHDLAQRLLRSRAVSSNEKRGTFFQENVVFDEKFQRYAEQEPLMLFMDPPDHTRLRRLVASAFTPRTVERLAPRIQELTDELLGEIETGEAFDLVEALARPLPVAVICELLGVPRADEPIFMQWSDTMAKAIDPGALSTEEDERQIETAQSELGIYIEDLLKRRRGDPGDDLLSALILVREGDDRLSEDELINLVILLLIAGHETTVNLIGNGAVALMRNQDQLARWQRQTSPSDTQFDKNAVDELLRYDSPVQMGMRIVIDPWEVGPDYDDLTIPAGDQVLTLLGAANRDPAVFEDPDQLDLGRANAASNLSFGGGIHHCLGMALARTEGQIALGSLVRRFGDLELVHEPQIRNRFVLRGFEKIVVRAS